jgi:preprotein translocase subunit SecE
MKISKNELLIIVVAVIILLVILVFFLYSGNGTMMDGGMNGKMK